MWNDKVRDMTSSIFVHPAIRDDKNGRTIVHTIFTPTKSVQTNNIRQTFVAAYCTGIATVHVRIDPKDGGCPNMHTMYGAPKLANMLSMANIPLLSNVAHINMRCVSVRMCAKMTGLCQ